MPHDKNLEVASSQGKLPELVRQTTCFFEADPDARLAPRVIAEGLGTLLLTAAVVGAGIVSQRVAPGNAPLGLALSAVTIAGTLVSLIVAFGAVSGGHFNPLITGLQWLTGERPSDCAAAYVIAQITGGVCGVLLAGVIFEGPTLPATSQAMSLRLLASETAASAGLIMIVFGCARSRRTETGPFAVGAWLAGAIVITPSGSYANPAVALASMATIGPTHLSAFAAFSFVGVEIVGALLALAAIHVIFPKSLDRRF